MSDGECLLLCWDLYLLRNDAIISDLSLHSSDVQLE